MGYHRLLSAARFFKRSSSTQLGPAAFSIRPPTQRGRFADSAGGLERTRSAPRLPLVSLHLVANAWRPGHLRRGRENCALTAFKDDGPVLIRHCVVHNRAVPVALHMSLEALVRVAPAYSADLPTGQHPIGESMEALPEARHNRRFHEVHERVAQASPGLEVDGQVDEVVEPLEAHSIEHRQEHLAIVIVRQVPEHHRRPTFALLAVGARHPLRRRRCRAGQPFVADAGALLSRRARLDGMRCWLRGRRHHDAHWEEPVLDAARHLHGLQGHCRPLRSTILLHHPHTSGPGVKGHTPHMVLGLRLENIFALLPQARILHTEAGILGDELRHVHVRQRVELEWGGRRREVRRRGQVPVFSWLCRRRCKVLRPLRGILLAAAWKLWPAR
mmetsp:Transcript_13696/g.30423  ORF Transcript_13696/g.30423 Transcript_13696/m.30423 type:complete len:387 (-) Transcript_13696:403-1563(-)